MAIVKMNRISIFGLIRDRRAIVEELQRQGVMEVREPDEKDLQLMDTASSIAQFEKYMQSAEDALAVLNEYVPEKTSFLSQRRILPMGQSEMSTANSDEILQLAYQIINLKDRINDLSSGAGIPIGDTALETQEDSIALEDELQACIANITELNQSRRDIELFYDHLSLRKDRYEVLAKIGILEYTFVIEGYMPQTDSVRMKELLESSYEAYVELNEAEAGEDVPVKFSNNAFNAPVEGITETYSMPGPTDIDPNPLMAFFYYLFFGIMFSDAGYGLLMAVVCGYLAFSDTLEVEKRRTWKMFFYCGVSTVFWGIMFGGFFGDLIHSVSTTFFHSNITLSPLLIDPVTQAMQMLIYSVGMGVVQILVGLSAKFYRLCRIGEVWDAVFDVGLWIITILGLGIFAAGMGLQTPPLSAYGQWLAIAGACGVVLTGGRKSKNIVAKLFGGVLGLYDITSYVSDALSYCRLMALGLATGSIAQVFNLLGSMFGGSFFGVIMYSIIFVFGHCLNFAMNALGAYVHTNRLQYVEYFSKFYDGGGKRFVPFRMRTKYYRFSDETAIAHSERGQLA